MIMDCRTHWGTANFISVAAAIRYYRDYGCGPDEVRRKLADKEIAIGEPKKPDGTSYEGCTRGADGRYWLRFKGQ